MNAYPTTRRAARPGAFSLVGLEALPCGCVSGVYQASSAAVELELVEAKGPHCVFVEHRPGGVVRLAVPDELL